MGMTMSSSSVNGGTTVVAGTDIAKTSRNQTLREKEKVRGKDVEGVVGFWWKSEEIIYKRRKKKGRSELPSGVTWGRGVSHVKKKGEMCSSLFFYSFYKYFTHDNNNN